MTPEQPRLPEHLISTNGKILAEHPKYTAKSLGTHLPSLIRPYVACSIMMTSSDALHVGTNDLSSQYSSDTETVAASVAKNTATNSASVKLDAKLPKVIVLLNLTPTLVSKK